MGAAFTQDYWYRWGIHCFHGSDFEILIESCLLNNGRRSNSRKMKKSSKCHVFRACILYCGFPLAGMTHRLFLHYYWSFTRVRVIFHSTIVLGYLHTKAGLIRSINACALFYQRNWYTNWTGPGTRVRLELKLKSSFKLLQLWFNSNLCNTYNS